MECALETFTEEEEMNSVRSFLGAVRRLIPAISFLVLIVGSLATLTADDVVLRWNKIAAQTATATNPFNQARVGAIVQVAVFEAVNSVTGQYEPYLNPRIVA